MLIEAMDMEGHQLLLGVCVFVGGGGGGGGKLGSCCCSG